MPLRRVFLCHRMLLRPGLLLPFTQSRGTCTRVESWLGSGLQLGHTWVMVVLQPLGSMLHMPRDLAPESSHGLQHLHHRGVLLNGEGG